MLASRIAAAAAKMRRTPIIETLEPVDDTLVIRCPVCGGVVATWDLDRLHWIVGDGEPDAQGRFDCPSCGLFACAPPNVSAVALFELAHDQTTQEAAC